MATEVGLGLEVDVGSSLKVSRERLGQRLGSLHGEWAAEARGSGFVVPFPRKNGAGHKAPRAVRASGRSCSGPIAHWSCMKWGWGIKVWDASNEPGF